MLTFTLPLFQSSYGLYGFYGFIEGGSKFITLSVSERKAVFLVATCRFSMSKTPFVTQLHSYAVSFTVGEVSFSNGYLYYIIIYNILYIII